MKAMRVYMFLLLLVAIITISAKSAFAQKPDSTYHHKFIAIESGLLIDSYNSMGPRLKFEFQHQLNKRWTYGIAFDSKWHVGHAATDQSVDLPTNSNSMTGTISFCLNPGSRNFRWYVGSGIGGIHLFWNDSNRWGLLANINATMDIRLSDKVYLFTVPIIFLPVSEFNYTTIKKDEPGGYSSFSFFPFGIKIRF